MKRASSADPRVRAEPGDPVLVLYTSGTTGALKAVAHSQASFAAITANILANLISPGRDSVMLHAASLIHASGTFVLHYWIRGGCAAVLPGFDPATYLEDLARYRATEINLVPTMFGMLAGSAAAERADVSSLRAAVYGASPMPRPLLHSSGRDRRRRGERSRPDLGRGRHCLRHPPPRRQRHRRRTAAGRPHPPGWLQGPEDRARD
jgi:acyl-CoA synthetase (AMP-forming)/AMP-acid ligase II